MTLSPLAGGGNRGSERLCHLLEVLCCGEIKTRCTCRGPEQSSRLWPWLGVRTSAESQGSSPQRQRLGPHLPQPRARLSGAAHTLGRKDSLSLGPLCSSHFLSALFASPHPLGDFWAPLDLHPPAFSSSKSFSSAPAA